MRIKVKKIGSFFNSFKFAFEGLQYLVRTQKNARFHLIATIFVVALGIWLKISFSNWIFISIAISLVWITELFNTSLENLFDLFHPGIDEHVKSGKDTSAAAVLITAILSVVIGLLTLGPALVQRIKQIIP